MSLREIGARCGTDKGRPHNYLSLYEALFREIWLLPKPRILEIGVQFGYSLQMWAEYFPRALITGIDSHDHKIKLDRTKIIIGDAYTPEMVQNLMGPRYDLIIDDGSHLARDQEFFVACYPTLLSRIGLLIVEDILELSTIGRLQAMLPPGFEATVVETDACRAVSIDSRLFIAWRAR